MRSTGYVFLSILAHAVVVFAMMMPTRSEEIKPAPIEVQVGDSEPQEAPAEEAAVQEEKPTPTPAPARPVAKIHRAKVTAIVQPETQEAPQAEQAATTNSSSANDDEKLELVPVKDAPPAGVEAAESAPAPADEGTKEAPSEAPAASANEQTEEGASNTPKAGASKAAAVSYLNLKQAPGNKAPQYPINARLQQRQGQTELVYEVTKEGKVTNIQIAKSSGSKDLDDAAIQAIAQFHYLPGQEGWARHPVNFSLKGPIAALPSLLRGKGAQND